MANGKQSNRLAQMGETRRDALTLLIGTAGWLTAADNAAPVRVAISETVAGEVNLNDARVAMQIWIRQMTQDLDLLIDTKLLASSKDVLEWVRSGQVDAVAVNIIEYRQIADLLDSSQIICARELEQSLMLVKRNSGIRRLGDLKGRKLSMLRTPKTCVAPAWLLTILEEGHFGSAEQFFGSVDVEAKFSKVVLPVFFGQMDGCLTSKRGFDTMCELNPQVGRDLETIATSPAMVTQMYMFRKNYRGVQREKLIKALSTMDASAAGRQLATLFQFDKLVVLDGSALAPALAVLAMADRVQNRAAVGVKTK